MVVLRILGRDALSPGADGTTFSLQRSCYTLSIAF